MKFQDFKKFIEQCHLPKTDYMAWDQDQKYMLCCRWYRMLDDQPYEYNPYSQGELLCESLGVSIEMLDGIKKQFYLSTKDEIRELMFMVVEDDEITNTRN